MNEMNKYLDKENISITTTLTFHSSGDDLDNKMKQLKVTKNRIFIGLKTKNLCTQISSRESFQAMGKWGYSRPFAEILDMLQLFSENLCN